MLAWCAIFLFAIGMPVFNAALLFIARQAIVGRREPTALSEATAFLWREYTALCFWCTRHILHQLPMVPVADGIPRLPVSDVQGMCASI